MRTYIHMNSSWLDKQISDLTLNDAIQASNEGFYLVCGDGKVVAVTNDK